MSLENVRTTALVLLTTIVVIAVMFFLKPILLPFLIALMVSYVLSPLVEKLTEYKIPRMVTLLALILLAGWLLSNLAEALVTNAIAFVQDFPTYKGQLLLLFEQYSSQYEWLDQAVVQATEWVFSLPIGSYTNSLVNSSVSLLSNTFLVMLFVIYLCLTAPLLPSKIARAYPGQKGKQVQKVLNHINQGIRKYINLHTLMSLLTGLSVGLVCWIIGVPFWFLWGFLAFILNYIPTIGSILASIPPVITAAVVLGLSPALWVAVLVIGVQTLWGNVVEPKIAGDSLGLSPLVILLSLVFWGWLWGIVGAILAVPMAVIIKVTCSNIPSLQSIGVMMDDK